MRPEATGRTGKPTPQRNKPTRPRDALGRPQAWDAPNELHLEDYDSLPLEENHRLGVEHWNAGRYFPAHEAWETAWKQARETEDAEFFKGLSQLGAGYVHLLRGNAHGAERLMLRGAGRVERYPVGHHGIDTATLARVATDHAADVAAGRLVPGPDADPDLPRLSSG
jgi:hypothetical protein